MCSLNEGFLKEEMSITQRKGIIVCLPNNDKHGEYLKKIILKNGAPFLS